jgi:hypothetical protein
MIAKRILLRSARKKGNRGSVPSEISDAADAKPKEAAKNYRILLPLTPRLDLAEKGYKQPKRDTKSKVRLAEFLAELGVKQPER